MRNINANTILLRRIDVANISSVINEIHFPKFLARDVIQQIVIEIFFKKAKHQRWAHRVKNIITTR